MLRFLSHSVTAVNLYNTMKCTRSPLSLSVSISLSINEAIFYLDVMAYYTSRLITI